MAHQDRTRAMSSAKFDSDGPYGDPHDQACQDEPSQDQDGHAPDRFQVLDEGGHGSDFD